MNTVINKIPAESELVIRIDYPGSGCLLAEEKLKFSGWFSADQQQIKAINTGSAKLEVLLQENNAKDEGYYSRLNFVGVKLPADSNIPNCVFLEEFKIEKSSHVKLKNPEASSYKINGYLNFKNVISPTEEKNFTLTISYSFENKITLTNFVEIRVLAKNSWEETKGGFINLDRYIISKDNIFLEGWVLKKAAALKKVEISINKQFFAEAEINLLFPEQGFYYPAHQYSKTSRFALSFSKKDLRRKLKTINLEREFSIDAKCTFEDITSENSTFEITGPLVLWPTIKKSKLWGRIEKVALAQDGQIEIAGWFVNTTFLDAKLYLEGRHRRVELEHGKYLEWFNRPDITNRFSLTTTQENLGFSIKVPPDILGKIPGEIKLVAETTAKRIEIGSNKFYKIITDLFHKTIRYKNSFQERAADISKVLSYLGIRKNFSRTQTTITKARNNPAQKILLATHNLSAVEGAPKIIYEIVKKIVETKIKGENLLVISAYPGELENKYQELGAKVIVDESLDSNLLSWNKFLCNQKKFNKIIKPFGPDLVICSTINSFWAADYAWKEKLPYCWNIQESINPHNAWSNLNFNLREIYLNALKNCSRAIFASEKTSLLYRGFIPEKAFSHIPNGIDLEKIEQEKKSMSKTTARESLGLKNETVISIIGTTTGRKGQDVFIKEMSLLKNNLKDKNFKFFIVGARVGQFLCDLETLSKELELDNNLKIVPETSHVAKYYLASDIMVMCSKEESSPLVSLEAFAYERPLVSTTAFGLADQLIDRENSLTYNLKNSGELAAKVTELINSGELQQELVQAAKKTVEAKYTLKHSVSKYLEVIFNNKALIS